MTRRSARLDKSCTPERVVVTTLNLMINRVECGRKTKQRMIDYVELLQYIIFNFDKIKERFNQTRTSFINYTKALYLNMEQIVEVCEKLLLKGEKIKMSLKKIRYYQSIYNKIYFDLEEKRILEQRSQTITTLIDKKKQISYQNCQEFKKYIKHFYINKLPLCYDVLNIIQSYCYYDKKVGETMKFVKTLKLHIVTLIDFARHSRKNGFLHFEEEYVDSDINEHWAFCIDEDEMAIQGVNCSCCGNYSSVYSFDWTPQNILCNCEYGRIMNNMD